MASVNDLIGLGVPPAVAAALTGSGVNSNVQYDGDLKITAGKGVQVGTSGSVARMGTATLVGGTVTVANTSVGANTKIFLSRATTGGTTGQLSYTKSNGVSFTITSTSGTETSTVDWMLVEGGF